MEYEHLQYIPNLFSDPFAFLSYPPNVWFVYSLQLRRGRPLHFYQIVYLRNHEGNEKGCYSPADRMVFLNL